MNNIFHSIAHWFSSSSDPLAQANAVASKTMALIQDAQDIAAKNPELLPNGAAKLEHVRTKLQEVWGEFDAIAVDFEQAWVVIGPLITALVSFYKATGGFKHAPSA